MATEPKTSMAANRTNTAIRVDVEVESKTIDDVLEDPEYIAVCGDANTVVADIDAGQTADRAWRRYTALGIACAISIAAAVITMVATRDFNLPAYWPVLAFCVLLGLALQHVMPVADISPDGISIDGIVYEHLTPEDRDALFQAQSESADVLHALLAMLKERYTAQESQQRVAKQQRDRARAATILAAHEPLA